MRQELTWRHHAAALYDNQERWYLRKGYRLVAVVKSRATYWAVHTDGVAPRPMTFNNADEAKAYAVAIVTLEN